MELEKFYDLIISRVSPVGWDIVSLLSKVESMSRSDLVAKLSLKPVQGQIELSKLLSAGMIDESSDPNDNRRLFYNLSAFGLHARGRGK